jgi:hypothetical protein
MYMAPIVKATVAPSHPALRRLVGVPVLLLAAAVALPWMAVQGAVALGAMAIRSGIQAVDYAGTIALGR